jgi:hypothetical protein
MSLSLKHIPASRTNRVRSQGQSTPEGKRRSSQNSIRRGLLARCNRPVRKESRPSFEALLTHHMARFQPRFQPASNSSRGARSKISPSRRNLAIPNEPNPIFGQFYLVQEPKLPLSNTHSLTPRTPDIGFVSSTPQPLRLQHLTFRIGFVREIAILPSQEDPSVRKKPCARRDGEIGTPADLQEPAARVPAFHNWLRSASRQWPCRWPKRASQPCSGGVSVSPAFRAFDYHKR